MALWTVTANFLTHGGVAYLTSERTWSHDLQRAATVDAEEALEPLLEWARSQEHEICDPYGLQLTQVDGLLTPLSAREKIRSEGPEPTLARLGYPVEQEAARRRAG